MTRVIRAPGKLVLVGEYAVLDGAPAVVLAVDRGVTCVVEPGGEAVVIETPDGDDRYVRPALDGAAPGRYVFTDTRPTGLSGKPGFGGSAAASVAACVAAGRDATDAFAIHRAVQGGGSGIDVAASIYGGMLRVEGASGERPPRVVPLEPVVPVVVWTGRSARTAPRVATYRAWPARERFVAESADIVEQFTDDPVAGFERAGRLLARMATRAGIAYLTPEIVRLQQMARDCGGAAKASGAGGGDCLVAIFADADGRARFEAACSQVGFPVIPVRPASGVLDLSTSTPPRSAE